MRYGLSAVSLALIFGAAGCAGKIRGKAAEGVSQSCSAGEVQRYLIGRFLVVEDDNAVLKSSTVLVPNVGKRDEYLNLLKAAVPDLFGGPSGVKMGLTLDSPTVSTVDDYVATLRDARRDSCKSPESKENSLCELPEPDYKEMRTCWASELAGHDGLVLLDIVRTPK